MSMRKRHPTLRLACLIDPAEPDPPSSQKSLDYLYNVARKLNIQPTPLTASEVTKYAVTDFDAMFLRVTATPGHWAYRVAKQAQGIIPVIDDPVSIELCCDKIASLHRFNAARLPTPPTLILPPPWQLEQAAHALGYPCVFKAPAACSSLGVFRACSEAELFQVESNLRRHTQGPILAQAYIQTSFDWRVGILDNRVLFVCQYRMAPHHWQIIKRNFQGSKRNGGHVTLRPHAYPRHVTELALQASQQIGNGFYGVDIKETQHNLYLMEVNDSPSLDHGVEDQYNNTWVEILTYFQGQQ